MYFLFLAVTKINSVADPLHLAGSGYTFFKGGSGSTILKCGSQDPDPEPRQNENGSASLHIYMLIHFSGSHRIEIAGEPGIQAKNKSS